MQATDNKPLFDAARAVPCIEVIEGPAPERAKPLRIGRLIPKQFYSDQSEELTAALKTLQSRERVVVALNADERVAIYRRPRK